MHAKRDCHTLWCRKETHSNIKDGLSAYIEKKKKKEKEKKRIAINQRKCEDIKREREIKKKRKSAMLQFRLVNTLEKHATSTDYHCGLYQSENAEA